MIPKYLVKGLLTASTGFLAKEAFVAKFELTNPDLLVTLPLSIITHNGKKILGMPNEVPEFQCPNRKKLHERCTDAKFFDRYTVPPVNIALHEEKVKLTRESYKALKADMKHTKQMKPEDPLHKKISDTYKQAENQTRIAESFYKAGEKEGALIHTMLAKVFDVKATVAESCSRFADSLSKPR